MRSVDDLCKESDFIIITTQLNEQTRHLINRTRLDSMKPNAVIVNVARGGDLYLFTSKPCCSKIEQIDQVDSEEQRDGYHDAVECRVGCVANLI